MSRRPWWRPGHAHEGFGRVARLFSYLIQVRPIFVSKGFQPVVSSKTQIQLGGACASQPIDKLRLNVVHDSSPPLTNRNMDPLLPKAWFGSLSYD